jgi:predicted amidohydrolase YtcJ
VSEGAELVVTNGILFRPGPGVASGPANRPGAVAITGGRIAWVGDPGRAREHAGPRTRVLDAGGGLITPGLHDAHLHLSEGGLARLGVDARGCRSRGEVAERARLAAADAERGDWITGRGWDEREFEGGLLPSCDLMSRACPAHPVLIRRVCGHVGVANRAALEAAGLWDPVPDPKGGRIERTSDGTPTGLVFETALDRLREAVPPPSLARKRAGILHALSIARRVGLTSVEDEFGWPKVLAGIEADGQLTARVRQWNKLKRSIEELVEWRESFPTSDRLAPGLLKGYLDGSLGARTALFEHPYNDAPDTRGLSTFDQGELVRRVAAADAAGFQVGLHAIGDLAVSNALDAFAAAAAKNQTRDRRHRIEHAQHLRPADVARFGQLGVVPSMQPSHLSADLEMVTPRVGEQRLAGAYAWRSLEGAGATLAFGSDFPIEPMDPRTSLHAACTRKGYRGEGPLGPLTERISLASALTAFTQGSAFATHREHELGRLEPGYLGDLTVFAVDLFAIPAEDLLTAPLLATVVGGDVVFEV